MITALLIEDDASALDDLATLVQAEGIGVDTARTSPGRGGHRGH